MTDAGPETAERIWLQHDTNSHFEDMRELAEKPAIEVAYAFTEYIRADLFEAQEKRVKELEEALKPFSVEAGWWFCSNYSASERVVEGFPGYDGMMTCGDLFRARAVMQEVAND